MCPLWVHLAFATGGPVSPFLRWEEGQPQMPEGFEGLLMEFPAGGPTDSPLNMSSLRTGVKPGSALQSQPARLTVGVVRRVGRKHLPGLCCNVSCIFAARGRPQGFLVDLCQDD